MNKVNEASPATNGSDLERLVSRLDAGANNEALEIGAAWNLLHEAAEALRTMQENPIGWLIEEPNQIGGLSTRFYWARDGKVPPKFGCHHVPVYRFGTDDDG